MAVGLCMQGARLSGWCRTEDWWCVFGRGRSEVLSLLRRMRSSEVKTMTRPANGGVSRASALWGGELGHARFRCYGCGGHLWAVDE